MKNIRSESFKKIIFQKSNFFEKWLLLVIVCTISFALLILIKINNSSYNIEINAVIKAPIRVVQLAPTEFNNRFTYLVNNNDTVLKEQIIACSDENIKYIKEIANVSFLLDSIKNCLEKNETEKIQFLVNTKFNTPDKLHPIYIEFTKQFNQFNKFLVSNKYYLKKELLNRKAFNLLKLSLKSKDLTCFQTEQIKVQNDSGFEKTKLFEYTGAKSQVIDKLYNQFSKQFEILEFKNSFNLNQVIQKKIQINISELEYNILTPKLHLKQSIESFQIEITNWIKKYTIRAPIDGRINLPPVSEKKSYLNKVELPSIESFQKDYYIQIAIPENIYVNIDTTHLMRLYFNANSNLIDNSISMNLNTISKTSFNKVVYLILAIPIEQFTMNNSQLTFKNEIPSKVILKVFHRISFIQMIKK